MMQPTFSFSLRKAARDALLLLLIAPACAGSVAEAEQGQKVTSQPGTKWTDEELMQAVAPMRAGRKLTPKHWPNGAKVAVCLSWDVDTETIELENGVTEPVQLTQGEYGAIQGLPRILALFDRYQIPGTFFIPAVTGLLHPQVIEELKRRPQHEIGIHGWIHENLSTLEPGEEERLLKKAIEFWTQALGKKPEGFRAPYWVFSPHTVDLIRAEGFVYESSAMSMDEPYELVSHDRATGVIELPVGWALDDAAYLSMPYGGLLPSPEAVFDIYREEFDQAYQEGTLFMLTMHPRISGHRSRLAYIEKLIVYIKSKPDVWFATGRQIAEYVKQQNGMAN